MKPEHSRRNFMKTSAIITGGILTSPFVLPKAYAAPDNHLKLALIGCGGRGTGAVFQAFETGHPIKLVAMADAFRDRLDGSLKPILDKYGAEKVVVPEERKFVGFDAYKQAIAEADGDETAAKGRYLKLRVEMMKAEADLLDHAEKELVREFDLAEEREKREREAQANKNNKQAARRDRETLAEMKRQAKESYLEDEPGIKKDFIILVLVLSCIAIGLTVLVNAAT